MKEKFTRKELIKGEDPVQHLLHDASDALQEHLQTIIGIAVVIFLAVAIIVGVRTYQQSALDAAATAYFTARDAYDLAMAGTQQSAQGEQKTLTATQVTEKLVAAKTAFEGILRDYHGTPVYEGSLFLAAKCAYQLRQSAEALEMLDRYRREFPTGQYAVGVTLLQAALHETDGRPEQAIAALREFLGANQAHQYATPELKMELARLLANAGKFEDAKNLYQEVLDLGDKSAYNRTAKEKRNEMLRKLGQPVPDEPTAAQPFTLG